VGALSLRLTRRPLLLYNNPTPGINPQGQIVGYYNDADGRAHGFLLSGGSFSTIDVPGAINNCNFDINQRGEIVGIYQSADGQFHGFVLTR
jgi:probable HAF family extracellular repeat protein